MANRFQNLVELGVQSCAKYADRPLFGTKRGGTWEWTTYRQFGELVDRCRAGLAALDVSAGDRVAFIADNRLEWAVAAYATYGLGAAFVPMYRAQRPHEWQFILDDCAAKVVFTADDLVHQAVQAMRPQLGAMAHVIGLALPATDPGSWAALLERGAGAPRPAMSPDPSAIAGFIYTSGTTGKPKGARLSHANIASNISAVHEIFTFEPEDRSLAFLPWAHSYGQTCEVHGLLSMGCSVAINDELSRLMPNLAEIQPTILFAVPRIFNRIHESVNRQISEHGARLQRVIRTGIRGAIKRSHGESLGLLERLELAFDEKVVFAKIRQKLGGRLKYAVSASATLGHEVAEFIEALGITVYEGYGLTETSPIVSANFPGQRRLGSVGRVLPGVRVVIDERLGHAPGEGEIIVHGPNVMMGYHNRPQESAEAILPDGGLRTGDLGHLDEDGFLYITGRIKEQYKLQNGKYVMPAPLEELLKLSPYIANVMIHGDGHPFNVALIVLNEQAVREWAVAEGRTLDEDLTRDAAVRALIKGELTRHVESFKSFERPRGFVLLREDFTPENGMLTPTLKLRRREVLERYGARLEALYATSAEVEHHASL